MFCSAYFISHIVGFSLRIASGPQNIRGSCFLSQGIHCVCFLKLKNFFLYIEKKLDKNFLGRRKNTVYCCRNVTFLKEIIKG